MKRLPLYPETPRLDIESEIARPLNSACDLCTLHENATTVCMIPRGKGQGVLFLGEHPGPQEDKDGKPFTGKTGQLLESMIEDIYQARPEKKLPIAFDNVVRCYTKEAPDEKQLRACRPYTLDVLSRCKPKRIVVMGNVAIGAMFGQSLPAYSVRRGFAWMYPAWSEDPVPVFLLIHPAAALRNPIVKSWVQKDLTWALTEDPPFKDQKDAVYAVVDDDAGANEARKALLTDGEISVDVEAFGKRFYPDYRLLSVSVTGVNSLTNWFWPPESLQEGYPRFVLKDILKDKKVKFDAHNSKYDMMALDLCLGVEVGQLWNDTQVLLKMLQSDAESRLSTTGALVGMVGHKSEADDARKEAVKLLSKVATRREEAEALKQKAIDKAVASVQKKHEKEKEKTRKKGNLNDLFSSTSSTEEAKRAKEINDARDHAERSFEDLVLKRAERELLERHDHPGYDAEAMEANRADIDKALTGIKRGDESAKYAYLWIPREIRDRYNARDSYSTALLSRLVSDRLKDAPEVEKFYRAVVAPSLVALNQVEKWGVPVNRHSIELMGKWLDADIETTLAQWKGHTATNPNSNPELIKYLYEELNLPVLARTETRQPSTDDDVLKKLEGKHPAIPVLRKYRKLTKARGTYVDQYLAEIAPDGRLHPSFRQPGAETGRCSCTDPNLYNLPRPASPDPFAARLGKEIRDFFQVPDEDEIVELDQSQIELRVAAALSQDQKMIDIFKSGHDFHQRTAEMISRSVWNLDPSLVHEGHRGVSKTMNFRILYDYNINYESLADELSSPTMTVTAHDARKVRDGIFGSFGQLADWIDRCVYMARKTGLSFTYWWYGKGAPPVIARRRNLYRIMDDDRKDRGQRINAENAAANTTIQGTSSDIVLYALARSVDWIKKNKFPARLFLSVYDSLYFQVKKGYRDELIYCVRNIMEDYDIGVPLIADVKVGQSIGSLQKLKKAA